MLNGVEIKNNYITYSQITKGGKLVFSLNSKPNKQRGTQEITFPYSMTKGKVVSIPYTTRYLNLFENCIKVDLASTTKGSEIYYTLNGTAPSKQSIKYVNPILLSKTTTIKAIAYKKGFKESSIFEIKATKAVLKNATPIAGTQNGVNYNYFEGTFQSINDLTKARIVKKGVMPEPAITGAKQKNHFAYSYTGYINVPKDGVYGFLTQSDDGSVLYIGNEKVINNDGSHAAIESTGEIALKKGYHPYRLLYFEDYEGEFLSWKWKLPGTIEYQPIPRSKLFTK